MTNITQAQRDELRRLHEAATPGEWTHSQGKLRKQFQTIINDVTASGLTVVAWPGFDGVETDAQANAALIAAAHNALPGLLDALDAAERERDELRGKLERVNETFGPMLMMVSEGATLMVMTQRGKCVTHGAPGLSATEARELLAALAARE